MKKKFKFYFAAAAILMALVLLPFVTTMPAEADTIRYLLGDINGDGVVNTGDAVLILHYATDQVNLYGLQFITGDVNRSGEVNTGDAMCILKICIDLLPQEWIEVTTTTPTAVPPVTPTPAATVAPTPTATVAPTPTATVAPTPTATVAPTPANTPVPGNIGYKICYVYSHINKNIIKTVTGYTQAGDMQYTALSPLTLTGADVNGNVRGFTPEYDQYTFNVTDTDNTFYIYCNEIFTNESGRTGSSWGDAIIIRKPSDLKNINTYNGLNKFYIMGCDTDISSYPNWTPIGTYDYGFMGGFDGYGYAISGMTITSVSASSKGDGYAGFFGSLNGSVVRDVDIIDGAIDLAFASTSNAFTRMYTGMVVGSCYNSMVIGCYSSGTIKLKNMGPGGTGGVVGSTWHSNTGATDSSKEGYITQCASSCIISSNYSMVAGVVGATNLKISECWFNGQAVSTGCDTAGICGYYNTSVSDWTMDNCWATGYVEGDGFAGTNSCGGVAGYATQCLYCCYAANRVNNKRAVNASNPYCQPLCGSMPDRLVSQTKDCCFEKGNFYVNGTLNSYWDNCGAGLRGSGYTREQMLNRIYFANYDTAIWYFVDGSYPQLINNPIR